MEGKISRIPEDSTATPNSITNISKWQYRFCRKNVTIYLVNTMLGWKKFIVSNERYQK